MSTATWYRAHRRRSTRADLTRCCTPARVHRDTREQAIAGAVLAVSRRARVPPIGGLPVGHSPTRRRSGRGDRHAPDTQPRHSGRARASSTGPQGPQTGAEAAHPDDATCCGCCATSVPSTPQRCQPRSVTSSPLGSRHPSHFGRRLTATPVEVVMACRRSGPRSRNGCIDGKPVDSVLEPAMRKLFTRYRLPPYEFHARDRGLRRRLPHHRHTDRSRVRRMGVPRQDASPAGGRRHPRRPLGRARLHLRALHLPPDRAPAGQAGAPNRRGHAPVGARQIWARQLLGFETSPHPDGRVRTPPPRCDGGATCYFGGMRMPPSTRMVSALR